MRDPANLSIRSRLFRGYGPMICLLASVLAVSLAVPSKVPERVVATGGASTDYEIPGLDQSTETTTATETTLDPAAPVTDPAAAAPGATVAGSTTQRSGAGASGTRGAGGGAGAGAAGGGGGGGGGSTAPTTCSGGDRMVAGVAYSPACKPWVAGADNGGTTANGVTATTITVSVRQNAFVNELLNLLADTAGQGNLKEPMAKTQETLNALVAYFNNTYHFYGRKLVLKPYDGVGNGQDELFGAGGARAAQDATRVEQELKAFADISGITLPYAEQLSRRRVINFGAPYPSKQWLNERNGYSWTVADCSTIATTASSYYLQRLAGKPAVRAGGDLNGRQRTIGVIAPTDPTGSYERCANEAIQTLRDNGRGGDLVLNERYQLNFNDMVNQARALAPKIRRDSPTTLFCACDPVMLLFLTGELANQNYQAEWISTGVAYVDQDLVGQLMEPSQWPRAFGVSFNGPTEGLRTSEAYEAYASVAGNVPASIGLEAMYYQLQMLAIGIMQAGPNLTPETFRQGMFEFPASNGRAGRWDFGPGDFATSDDAREIYWDAGAFSEQNERQGAWKETLPGQRFAIGRWPAGDPALPPL